MAGFCQLSEIPTVLARISLYLAKDDNVELEGNPKEHSNVKKVDQPNQMWCIVRHKHTLLAAKIKKFAKLNGENIKG